VNGIKKTEGRQDGEIIECLNLSCGPRRRGSVLSVQAYIKLKMLTGMARSDLLRLTVSNLREDGIRIQRHKTKDTPGS
jgi:integrase